MGNCCVQPPLSRPGSFTPLQKNRQRESTTTVGSKPGKECRRGDGTKVSSPRGKGPDAGRRFERVESDVAPRRGACASSLAEKLGESTADVTCELITLQATPLTNNLRTPHDAMLRSTLRTPQDALDNSDLFSDDAARQRPRHPLSSTAARPFSDSGIHPFFDAGARSFSDSGVRPFPEGAARPRPQLLDPSRTTLTVPYFASTNPFSSTLSCTPIQVDDTYYTGVHSVLVCELQGSKIYHLPIYFSTILQFSPFTFVRCRCFTASFLTAAAYQLADCLHGSALLLRMLHKKCDPCAGRNSMLHNHQCSRLHGTYSTALNG
ncbi:hypothetical protein DIPPA_31276, partial [Diplonema papillatum]